MQKKYEVLGVVGEGAYGIVYKCKNKETNKFVAIKKFKEVEDELVQKTMKRELKMLQSLRHPNIVDFQEAFIHKNKLFLVFEYVEKNLLELLETSPEGLDPKLIRSFAFQMCKAINYLHSKNILHRDVKPENLLITENNELKLCDFGFARKILIKNNNIENMTDYVATRWYRSPELLLSGGIYGPEVDYWAVGCIIGELADGNPMFPGENEIDQLECIIKVMGNLPESLVNMYYENPIYNGKELLKVNRPESLERRYMGKLGPSAIDFLKGLLQLDPKKRLNGDNVFKHKYFKCFMDMEENKYLLEGKKENNIKNDVKNENNNLKNDNNNNNVIQTKVINNTTNINIINYNNFNSVDSQPNMDNNNNDKISKKQLSVGNLEESNSNINLHKEKEKEKTDDNVKKIDNKNNMSNSSIKKLNTNNSFGNGLVIKDERNLKNKGSYLDIINEDIDTNSKKSLSLNKNNKICKFANMTMMCNNFPQLKNISSSQGKTDIKLNKSKTNINKSNKNTNNNKNVNIKNFSNKKITIHNSTYLNNSHSNNNINNTSNNKQISKNQKNNKHNNNHNGPSPNMLSIFPNENLDLYKTYFNKSNEKYNYQINTGYIKEENKKYNGVHNNIIDENEEYIEYTKKKKTVSKEKKKSYNNKLLIKYSDNYKYNFGGVGKNIGYGTFYKSNTNDIYSNGFGKKKNKCQLPQLIKLYNNNANGLNSKNNKYSKYNSSNKNKFKY